LFFYDHVSEDAPNPFVGVDLPKENLKDAAEARREDEFFDSHMLKCKAYYGLPPKERPAYLLGLITKARQGDRASP
jgi:hypothetical protein